VELGHPRDHPKAIKTPAIVSTIHEYMNKVWSIAQFRSRGATVEPLDSSPAFSKDSKNERCAWLPRAARKRVRAIRHLWHCQEERNRSRNLPARGARTHRRASRQPHRRTLALEPHLHLTTCSVNVIRCQDGLRPTLTELASFASDLLRLLSPPHRVSSLSPGGHTRFLLRLFPMRVPSFCTGPQ
jgi:hypothetical protein